MTHTPIAERLAVEFSRFVLMTYVYCDCGLNPDLPLARQINTLPTEILLPNENYFTALLIIGFYLKPVKMYLFFRDLFILINSAIFTSLHFHKRKQNI